MKLVSRVVAAAATLTTAIALTACGAATPVTPTGSLDVTAPATAPSTAAPAAGTGDTVPLAELGKRTAAAAAEAGPVNITMTLEDEKLTGVMDMAEGASHLKGRIAGQDLDVIIVDKAIYLGGQLGAEASGGKKWVKISADGSDMLSAMLGPMLEKMTDQMNVATMFEGLDADASVASVEGDLTTYEITLTSEQTRAMTEKLLPSGTPVPTGEMSSTILQTIDGNDLPTKVVIESTVGGESVEAELTYSGWGTAETVTAPPAAEVGSFEMPTLPTPPAVPTK